MAHYQQLRFIEIASTYWPNFFTNTKVLEIGSWDANGSIRGHFSNCDYTGTDIAEGPGVDLVRAGQDLEFPSNTFDVAISCECFEHNPQWEATFENMHRMLKPGGLFLITCATVSRGEHGTRRRYPLSSLTVTAGDKDYYRNLSKGDLKRRFSLDNLFDAHEFFYNIYSRDLYFIGIKTSGSDKPGEIPMNFATEINNIKRRPAPSRSKHIRTAIKFWFCFFFAKTVGEKIYHDVVLAWESITRTRKL